MFFRQSAPRVTGLALAALGAILLAQISVAQSSDQEVAGEVSEEVMTFGAEVYLNNCSGCHGETGRGDGSAPGVANNSRIRDEAFLIRQILGGSEYMPGFAFLLTDAEVAAAATYIRNAFGNEHGLVGEEQVAALR